MRSSRLMYETETPGSHCAARPGGRAFTILEILVVVAIISLLAAVLLPSLAKVREQTQTTRCQSNLRQIANGWRMYTDAYEGSFGPDNLNAEINFGGLQGKGSRAFGANPRSPVPKPINPFVQPTLKPVARTGAEIFQCPSDRGSPSKQVTPSYYESRGTSYRANKWLIGQGGINCSGTGDCEDMCQDLKDRLGTLTRKKVSQPAEVLLAGDFEWFEEWAHSYEASPEGARWHGRQGYYNLVFVDAHAAFLQVCQDVWVAPKYTVIPLREFYDDARCCQASPEWD
jgi:prepilin-type N-terminal cleavage/methylation domain-containing protein